MIRKLLFFVVFTFTTLYGIAQAPGNGDVLANVVPITLNYGTTTSTGFQYVLLPYQNNVAEADICTGFTLYGTSRDGMYSIDVAVAGDYRFQFANNGTTWKSLSLYSAFPVNAGNCIGAAETAGQRDAAIPLDINLSVGTYYIVIDGWTAAAGYPPSTTHPAPYVGGPWNRPVFELLITAPISNDECVDAIELFSDVDCSLVTYTNEGATGSTGHPAPGCANYLGGDVWFSYVVNDSGEFTITTEPGVMTDSGMAVYSGTCGSLTLEDCDDDFGTGAMSTITLTGRTPGEIIYIRLWEYGNNNNGTFDICITTPLLPGDNGVYADCPNERSKSLTSDFACPPGINTSDTVFGNLQGGALANKPVSAANSTICSFTGLSRRYEEINFTVPTTGVYVIEMTAAAGFDGMGYIVETGFTPGVCGAGFVVRDDDSGVGLRSELTATLTAGVNYTLITTEWGGPGSGNSPYTWEVTTGPDINWTTASAPIEWYTAVSGGTPIKSGAGFNPVNYPGSGLTDTSTPGIYSYWYACPGNPTARTRVDYVIGKIWTGATSNNWNTATNWSGNTVPTDTQCVYIPTGITPPIISDNGNADAYNLTVEDGALLVLAANTNADNAGSTLTVQDFIDIQGTGSLIVRDDASLIQVNDTPARPNSGAIELHRNTNIRLLDYVYWSSPVENFDVSDVYDINTPTNRIYEWIPTTATGYLGMPGNVPIITGNWNNLSSGIMDIGKGYAVRGPNGHTTAASIASATFNGVANNGVITQSLSSGGYSGGGLMYNPYGTNSLSVTQLDDNWNLIGNPYPSALNANAFLTHPSNNLIEGAVHIWTHNIPIGGNGDSFYDDFAYTYSVNDYVTYNISGSTYPNETFAGQIASGQGFFVLALNDNETGSVTFNNSMRDRTYSNTAFYRTAEANESTSSTSDYQNIERHRIWLSLLNQNDEASNTLVGYIEGATQEKDRLYDAYAREVNNLNIYSKANDDRLTIQGRSLPFDNNDQVPIGIVIPQAGEYTIAISKVDGLFTNGDQNIYLEDLYNDVIHNLKATPYTFTETEAIDYEDRFVLRYTNEALSVDDLELSDLSITAPKGKYVKVNTNNNLVDSVVIYDLLGRVMLNKTSISNDEFVYTNHNLSSGAYIVKVTLESGQTKTQKIILKD
ncbi:T9SS sorting signal type C domain-containing protein [Psychroserpens sp. S379A]|uniref:T9SS sorting signal type C domain-containing protein n=1 Tax=Psychroserpens sp. S379A TaxID=3415137 RepID=UPI003C7D0DE9